MNCSSIQVVDSWKNEDMVFFKPKKLLVVGVTDNLTARKIFEEKLKNEFLKRNINAVESINIFDAAFTDSEKSEAEIQQMIAGLSEKGFDAVIISAVKGVDEQNSYYPGYYTVNYNWTHLENIIIDIRIFITIHPIIANSAFIMLKHQYIILLNKVTNPWFGLVL